MLFGFLCSFLCALTLCLCALTCTFSVKETQRFPNTIFTVESMAGVWVCPSLMEGTNPPADFLTVAPVVVYCSRQCGVIDPDRLHGSA